METTKEDREWLRVNWSVGESTFRQWVAGSDRAHEIVPRALRDVDTLVEMLRRAALGQEPHIRLFHDPLCGECLGCQARAVLVGDGEATVGGKPVEEVPLSVAATCRDCGWELRQTREATYAWRVRRCYPDYHLIQLFHGEANGVPVAQVAIDKVPQS